MAFLKRNYLPMVLLVVFLIASALQIARTQAQQASVLLDPSAPVIVIDAGHGGEDGGASTTEGVPESQINLSIALRLNDLFHLMGYDTVMVRTTDVSIYSSGSSTLSQKKVSDLKNRVALIEQTEQALLVSIHQNTFPDGRYFGAQVFSAPTQGSDQLASIAQQILTESVDPENRRSSKMVSPDVYLMNHISCTGILVECGFLSNADEALKLQTDAYQIKLAAALCDAVNQYTREQGNNEV